MELILKYFSDFTDHQLEQFRQLGPLYRDWNEKINVISRKDIESLYEKHVLHSLSIAAAFQFPEGTRILDLGTGGGFPGIPLAIFFPGVNFHLVDSVGKKLKVVEAVASGIGLKNVTSWHGRAEEIKDLQFDYVVSRAVAPLKDLWKWSRPLFRKKTIPAGVDNEGGIIPETGLICLKGGDLAKEIQESNLRPRMVEVYELFQEEYFHEKYLLHIPR